MKKFFIAAAFLVGLGVATAQSSTDKDKITWYHKDFATTKVHGVNTDNAYKFLESKGLKPKTVVVGVLDSGVQVDHPGLAKNMWVNVNEIPNNGKDDDGNGYVDDIHGWNFIGGKNADIDVDNMEVTRVVAKYQPLFEGSDSARNKENQAKMKEEFDLYMKAKSIHTAKSMEAQQNYQTYSMINKLIPDMVTLLGDKGMNPDHVAAIKPVSQNDAIAKMFLAQLVNSPEFKNLSTKDFETKVTKEMKNALDHFEPQAKQYDLNFDPRKEIVGDNYENYSEKYYGNNNYEGPDAMHGTHVAAIIAGLPNEKEANQYGVASKVAKILTVRTVPNGDERDKDVANSIRYAVDNGAKIINMSFGKPVSPGKTHVWDAFKYAESKGVLLVKAAGNENEDVVEHVAYPTNFKNPADATPFVKNMIVVGASTPDASNLRADFSNYNQKAVDVFAPGVEIYSAVPKSIYEYSQGTSMASPVVAGAAAVLLAYMPTLTPEQIIESLKKTVNKGPEDFAKYSSAGGVIDVRKAAEYAYDNFYKKGNTNTKVKKHEKKSVKK